MQKDFLNRLRDYYLAVAASLKGDADVASIFPNSTDIGISRERLYAEFLRQHIPASCTVSFGGFLFDQNGNESRQIDVIVCDSSAPQFNFNQIHGEGKAFACIDGCVAVASIKSTLDRRELRDALRNIASLPDKLSIEGKLSPLLKVPSYPDWPYKIVYATKGISRNIIGEELTRFYEEHADVPPEKRPNIIHVAGICQVERSPPEGEVLRDGTILPPHAFVGRERDADLYALSTVVARIQERAAVAKHILFDYSALINHLYSLETVREQ
jgi:hypothetical protein